MEIKILKEEKKYKIQSIEDFKRDIYLAPRVHLLKEITFSVKNVELKIKTLISSTRVKTKAKSLWQYKEENNIKENTKGVLEDAYKHAKNHCYNTWAEDRDRELYKSLQAETVNSPHQEALDLSLQLIKEARSPVMLHDAINDSGSIQDTNTYLYFYLRPLIFKGEYSPIDVEEKIKEYLAYGLLNVIQERRYQLEDTEEKLKYIKYLCDDIGYSVDGAIEVVEETNNMNILAEEMSKSDELEEFILKNVDKNEIYYTFREKEV